MVGHPEVDIQSDDTRLKSQSHVWKSFENDSSGLLFPSITVLGISLFGFSAIGTGVMISQQIQVIPIPQQWPW
jgi:hypothetical protein